MSQPAVLFPDVAAMTIGFLTSALAEHDDTAVVVKDVPTPRPARFVTIRRGGGPRATLISDEAQVLFECWAETSGDAQDLAQLSRALVHSMAGTTQDGVAVYRVTEFAGPADLPDPLSEQARYVFTVQVHVRGSAL